MSKSLGEALAERINKSSKSKGKKKYDPFDELAEAMGVPPEKRDTARGALREFIHATKAEN